MNIYIFKNYIYIYIYIYWNKWCGYIYIYIYIYTGWNDKIVVLKKTTLQLYLKKNQFR